MSINYFRGSIGIICKKIIYHILTHKFKIYKTKTEMYLDKIMTDDLFKHMDKYDFLNLKKIIEQIKMKSLPLVMEKVKIL